MTDVTDTSHVTDATGTGLRRALPEAAGPRPHPLASGPVTSRAAAPAGDAVADAVRAALAVPGVRGVRVDQDADGAALLRLELVDGADEDDVARAVGEQLQRAAVPAPAPAPPPEQAPPVRAEPATGPATDVATGAGVLPDPAGPGSGPASGQGSGPGVPQQLGRPAPRPRTGRVPVPSVSSPTVAATPAPQWLGEGPATGATGDLRAPGACGVPSDLGSSGALPAAAGDDRVRLQRVQVVTEGLTTTATVVLAAGPTSHTGVAEAAATPTGGQRCVATAALRALESAAQGRLRGEVDAVGVQDLGGQRCVLVLLGTVSALGPEQLVGAALAGGDVAGAVVRAVLAAGNRRLAPGSADPCAGRGR